MMSNGLNDLNGNAIITTLQNYKRPNNRVQNQQKYSKSQKVKKTNNALKAEKAALN